MRRIIKAEVEESDKIYNQEEDKLEMEVLEKLDGEMALGKFQNIKFTLDKAIYSLQWEVSGAIPLWFYATPNHTGENEVHFQIMSKLHNPDNLQGVDVTGTTTVGYEPPLTLDKYLKIVEEFIQRNFR